MAQVIYRATIYRPRSVDSAENVALTPRTPGNSHSDAFKVATRSGVAGFQPYLDKVSGRNGRRDPLTKKTDQGRRTLTLGDVISGSTQLERWVTEFLGDASGSNQLLGNKCYVEASYDLGASWVSHFTGRIRSSGLDGADSFAIALEDMSVDLRAMTYVGRPHSSLTHVSLPTLLPIGPSAAYGSIPAAPPLSGTFQTMSGVRRIVVDAASRDAPGNIVTAALAQAERSWWDALFGTAVNSDVRVRINSASPSIVDKELQPILLRLMSKAVGSGIKHAAAIIDVQAVADTSDQYYINDNLATIPDGTVVTFRVHPVRQAGESTVERAPMLIGDVDPIQHIADLLDGKYGHLDKSTGAPLLAISYTSSVTNAIGDPQLIKRRYPVKKSLRLDKAIAQVNQDIDFAPYFDADGKFVLVDMRLPSSLSGLTTITNADVWPGRDPRWQQGRDGAIRRFIVKVYIDRYVTDQELGDIEEKFPALTPGRITSVDLPIAVDDFGRIDIGDGEHTVDAIGLRAFQDELDPTGLATRINRIVEEAGRIADQYRAPYSWGPMETTLEGPRTANMLALTQAAWALVDVDELPDPNTNDRGGIRLVRILEHSEDGDSITVRLQDAGPNAIATPPTLGALAAGPNSKHEMDVPLTINAAGDGIEFQIAVTDQATGVRPVDSSPLWRPGWGGPIVTSQTITRQYLPSNSRIWPRGRSVPNRLSNFSLPSAWVYPSTGPEFLDTTAITAPSVLAVSVVSARAFTLTFTPGDLNYVTDILLSSPSGDTPIYTGIRQPAGSTQHRGAGTVDGDTYGAQVRHADGFGGFSALSNKVTWMASGADPQAPDIRSAFAFEVIAP